MCPRWVKKKSGKNALPNFLAEVWKIKNRTLQKLCDLLQTSQLRRCSKVATRESNEAIFCSFKHSGPSNECISKNLRIFFIIIKNRNCNKLWGKVIFKQIEGFFLATTSNCLLPEKFSFFLHPKIDYIYYASTCLMLKYFISYVIIMYNCNGWLQFFSISSIYAKTDS